MAMLGVDKSLSSYLLLTVSALFLLGDGFLFIYSSTALAVALFFMMLVKHGEVKQQSKQTALETIEHMES